MNGKIYNVENCTDYDSVFNHKGMKIKCYSKKEMKKMYKYKVYTIIGEYRKCNRKKEIGTFKLTDMDEIENDTLSLFHYKSFNRLIYKEKGYLKVKEDKNTFITVIGHRLLLPFYLSGLALLLVFGISLISTPDTVKKENVVEVTPVPTPAPTTDERFFKPTVQNVNYATNKAMDSNTALPVLYFYGGTASNGDAGIVVNKNTDIYKIAHYILNDGTEIATSAMLAPGEKLMSITLNSEGLKLGLGEYRGVLRLDSYMKNDKGEFRKTGEFKFEGQFEGQYYIEKL